MSHSETKRTDKSNQQDDNSNSPSNSPGRGEYKENFKRLQSTECLHGFRVDNIDGPECTTRPVAKFVGIKPPFVQEVHDILTEAVTARTEREANYVHHGWSIGAIATLSPWTMSRIAANNQPNPKGAWVTRRTLVPRLSLRLSVNELAPVPEFEDAVKEALKEPTIFGQFRAVYRVLHEWGDMAIDMGTSLAFTDLETNMLQLPDQDSYHNAYYLSNIRTARLTGQGIPEDAESGWYDGTWLIKQVPPPQWRKIRISAVAPTVNLLSAEIQSQLSQLYAKRLSYVPSHTIGPIDSSSRTHDDIDHASHEVSGIIVYATDFIRSLTFIYKNGTRSKHQGTDSYGAEHEFMLTDGEFIAEMLIWGDDWIRGLQFVTNFGRCSPHFGGGGTVEHTPTIARSKGGVLVGTFTVIKQFGRQGFIIHKIQGIWRHDLVDKIPKQDDVFSDYYGAKIGGLPFNDRVIVKNSDMAISKIEIRCDTVVNSIQFTYIENTDKGVVETRTVSHGGFGGEEKRFVLEPGEHVISVSGRYDDERVTQLCFVTNRGKYHDELVMFSVKEYQSRIANPSPICPPETSMENRCVCNIDKYLNAVMFIWTPL
ncbi:unnamed protein product [Rhizoctonia solani]|uniref:Jacalin-type lectin domain-containing protein n=1 Tax=Rhizoctonia solani TaxID=456999 RepID=A0A8H3D677_9AGAM|nr:unnamed protein product [Rhizoctonia solani]